MWELNRNKEEIDRYNISLSLGAFSLDFPRAFNPGNRSHEERAALLSEHESGSTYECPARDSNRT
jgi:hypothetical protein